VAPAVENSLSEGTYTNDIKDGSWLEI